MPCNSHLLHRTGWPRVEGLELGLGLERELGLELGLELCLHTVCRWGTTASRM